MYGQCLCVLVYTIIVRDDLYQHTACTKNYSTANLNNFRLIIMLIEPFTCYTLLLLFLQRRQTIAFTPLILIYFAMLEHKLSLLFCVLSLFLLYMSPVLNNTTIDSGSGQWISVFKLTTCSSDLMLKCIQWSNISFCPVISIYWNFIQILNILLTHPLS